MRDPKRIERIMAKLERFWINNPDMRLGQIIGNLKIKAEPGIDIYYVEDEYMEKELDIEISDTTLAEFYDKCMTHDWTYGYSDDPSVNRKGQSDWIQLRNLASDLGADAQKLLMDMRQYHLCGGTVVPKRPNVS